MSRIFVCKEGDNVPESNNILLFNSQGLLINWSPGTKFLEIDCNDITEPQKNLVMPNKQHIKKMLQFFGCWNKQEPMIVQCQMGISRSTAAAIVACTALRSDINPNIIARLVRKKSKAATPNKKIIELADEELNLNGTLIEATKNIGRGDGPAKPFSIDVDDELTNAELEYWTTL